MAEKLHNTILTVAKVDAGKTLQDFLAERLKLSKRAAKNLIDKRLVWVNRKCTWMARHELRSGDTVEAQAGLAGLEAAPRKHVPILVQNDHYLVINKPYGLLSEGEGSAEAILREQLKTDEVWAVHRLDKDTSGCLLFAKSKEAFDAIVSSFKTRKIKKVYHFLAVGKIEVSNTTITDPIDGDEAKTNVKRIAWNEDVTYGSARIETGRTHQIRLHLSSIRHPIVGDRLHGLKQCRDERFMKVPRQMLHALEIEFADPLSQTHFSAHAPLPADFRLGLRMFGLGK